jgi:monothiol glutaredoxin
MNETIELQIKDYIDNNDIVLFMKGDATFPQCGFSAAVAGLLNNLQIKFKDVNVLESNEMREAIKQYSSWPTIPQLYIKGEFIGGCDIIKEMFQSGEFTKLLDEQNIEYNLPKHI